jgi:hypothetical protein
MLLEMEFEKPMIPQKPQTEQSVSESLFDIFSNSQGTDKMITKPLEPSK